MKSGATFSSSRAGWSPDVGLVRLYLMRLAYLILGGGLCAYIWPSVISHTADFAASSGVRTSLLAGLGVVALLGLRYPLKMLPVLIFELIWKAVYLAFFALPLWRSHQISAAVAADVQAVLMVVIFIPLIPWDYVVKSYALSPGDRWK